MTAERMGALEAVDAEQGVLGECMRIEHANAYPKAAEQVGPGDWVRGAHATLWEVFGELASEGLPLDPTVVLERLRLRGDLTRVGGAAYLHTLYAAASDLAFAEHLRMVGDAATRRRVHQAGQRMMQRAESGDVDAAGLVAWAGEQVSAARDERAGVGLMTVSYDEFLHRASVERRMVIPGLLGEGDRMILTGTGGLGKSTLLLQIALCAAAGLPPLHYQEQDPTDPVRVMVLDCENPDHRRKTNMANMVNALIRSGLDPRPYLRIDTNNGNPFDLLNPANALTLLRTVEHDRPQLLSIGPIYKLHNDDPDKESVVKKITAVLDRVREMGVAVITEAHPNKASKSGGPMSPSGSSLWEWWPEFGLGLRLDPDSDEHTRLCKLERWRIDRDASQWPLYVRASGDAGLPWERSHYAGPDAYAGGGEQRGAWPGSEF